MCGGVVQGHALGPSSVRQIKGCICLYCAAKSPPPLTADTSHVDEEEGVSTGPLQRSCEVGGGGETLCKSNNSFAISMSVGK